MFPKVEKNAVELLKKTLKFSPDERLTIDEVLDSPFFDGVRKKEL